MSQSQPEAGQGVVGAVTIHAILACHDRRALTVRAIQAAAESASAAALNIDFTLFDDGSTDHTAEAVRSLGLPVTTLTGDGTAFWARSMSLAERYVLADAGIRDWIIWLNDDVRVDPDTFARLAPQLADERIIVAAMRDPRSGEVTYSGLRRTGWHPLRFATVQPSAQLQPVDTFNGNLVCIPVKSARVLGGIDGEFAHAWADIDYGLRAGKAGIPTLLAPGTYGTCPRNSPDQTGSIITRWHRYRSRKGGGEPASIKRLIQRHEPAKWPWAQWASIARWWFSELRGNRD